MYEYADWRNDIYRVTRDRIIDRDKKPFGKESFRSAPINNIQSVGHEIPNTIGLILNVGDVKINVGEETLTFDGVHDPALVHQDISRRMEELAAKMNRHGSHKNMHAWRPGWIFTMMRQRGNLTQDRSNISPILTKIRYNNELQQYPGIPPSIYFSVKAQPLKEGGRYSFR